MVKKKQILHGFNNHNDVINLELGFTIKKKKSYYLNKVKEIKVLSHEGEKSCDYCKIYHT